MTAIRADLKREMISVARLAFPVVLGELGWIAMGVVDTMMVGRLSPEAIGAVSVGRAAIMVCSIFGIGMLLGLDTLVSNAFGARRADETLLSLVHGLYLAIAISVPLTLIGRFSAELFDPLGVNPAVAGGAAAYVRAVSWSILPILLYAAFRRYLQAVDQPRPVMFALISANAVNVFANWLLIFGNLGAPALGAEGAGWATVVSSAYLAGCLGLAAWTHEHHDGSRLRHSRLRPESRRVRQLLVLGFPAALQLLLEMGVFAAATALIARLDAVSLAAHQISIHLASVTFMIPLGVSSAAAVRVGQALGRDDRAGAARAGWMALLLGSTFMAVAALAFVTVPRVLLGWFTPDPEVIATGVVLLFLAAVFQLFDGIQVIAIGALRGAGDTRTPLIWQVIAYWLIALPLGYVLCFRLDWGAAGMWAGLCMGLIVTGVVLSWIWKVRTRDWHTLGA